MTNITCLELEIHSAEVSDSAVFYCTLLLPSVTGNQTTLNKNLIGLDGILRISDKAPGCISKKSVRKFLLFASFSYKLQFYIQYNMKASNMGKSSGLGCGTGDVGVVTCRTPILRGHYYIHYYKSFTNSIVTHAILINSHSYCQPPFLPKTKNTVSNQTSISVGVS